MEDESITKNYEKCLQKSHFIQLQEISGMGFW